MNLNGPMAYSQAVIQAIPAEAGVGAANTFGLCDSCELRLARPQEREVVLPPRVHTRPDTERETDTAVDSSQPRQHTEAGGIHTVGPSPDVAHLPASLLDKSPSQRKEFATVRRFTVIPGGRPSPRLSCPRWRTTQARDRLSLSFIVRRRMWLELERGFRSSADVSAVFA